MCEEVRLFGRRTPALHPLGGLRVEMQLVLRLRVHPRPLPLGLQQRLEARAMQRALGREEQQLART